MAVVVRCDKSANAGSVFRASTLVAIRIGGLPTISAALSVAHHSLYAWPTAWPLASRPNACFNPNAAMICAEALSRKGCDCVQPNCDPATGDCGDAKVIKKLGDVPDDLSTL